MVYLCLNEFGDFFVFFCCKLVGKYTNQSYWVFGIGRCVKSFPKKWTKRINLLMGRAFPKGGQLVAMNFALRYQMNSNDIVTKNYIVGGWTNPVDKKNMSLNGHLPFFRGENYKIFETTTQKRSKANKPEQATFWNNIFP